MCLGWFFYLGSSAMLRLVNVGSSILQPFENLMVRADRFFCILQINNLIFQGQIAFEIGDFWLNYRINKSIYQSSKFYFAVLTCFWSWINLAKLFEFERRTLLSWVEQSLIVQEMWQCGNYLSRNLGTIPTLHERVYLPTQWQK